MSIFDNLTNKLTNFLDFGNSEVDLNRDIPLAQTNGNNDQSEK